MPPAPPVDRGAPALGRLALLSLLGFLGFLGFLGMGCRGALPPHEGPIVLITFDGLRADVVGGLGGPPGLTPHLDRLIRESDWAGRAISPSSWTAPAMASLWTGLRPWQHQVLHPGQAVLSPTLATLPAVLKAAGYRTYGFASGRWLKPRFGFSRGFDSYRDLARGWVARTRLAGLSGGRELVWIHLPEPAPPLIRRDRFLGRLGAPGQLPERLPERIGRAQMEPFLDPAVRLPLYRRRALWAMYRLNVAWADERLGDLLAGLRESGQWDRTLLVVTADHGEELGERGQVLEGGSLARQLIEVPLAIKLPAGFGRRIEVPAGSRPGTARLWATLVEAAGGAAAPAVAPSLFRRAAASYRAPEGAADSYRAPEGALSELYLRDGTNLFSWVEGDRQLLWESRFAPPALGSDGAFLVAGARLAGLRPLSSPRGALGALGPLVAAFAAAPPLSGLDAPVLTLEAWEGPRGSRSVDDPQAAAMAGLAGLAGRLAAAWGEFLPAERAPWAPGVDSEP